VSPTPAAEAVQSPELSGALELIDIDLSPIQAGAPTLHLVSDHAGIDTVIRGGVRYYPAPIEIEGYDRGGLGAPPQPVLRVGDVLGQVGPWVWGAQDILGAQVTRTLVLRDWLDDGVDPDPTGQVLVDVHRIEQKIRQQTFGAVEWQLVARFDQAGRQIPARTIVRDVCELRYRVWDSVGGAFDYTLATCPYVGANLFDVTNAVTVLEGEDRCSKNLKGCDLRFPDQPLPTTAFPGVGRRR
jgi:lambda family phage minor tail protein L